MTNLISSQSGHWYAFKDGIWSPCHKVVSAARELFKLKHPERYAIEYPNPEDYFRKTTLRDARMMQLVPSVTGITNVVAAPGLNNWKETQAVLSAMTLPREREDEFAYMARCLRDMGASAHDSRAVAQWCYNFSPRPVLNDDEFALKVVEDMQAQAEAAKKLGSELHDVISYGLHHPNDPWIPPFGEAGRLALPAQAWIDENLEEIHAVEKIVGSLEHGYAGTLDLDCELKGIGHAILDWKSQNVKRNGNGPKPEFYLSYGKQLAAYAMTSWPKEIHNLVSVIIDKANDGEVFIKVWDNPGELWAEFLNNCATWRFENRYDPRKAA